MVCNLSIGIMYLFGINAFVEVVREVNLNEERSTIFAEIGRKVVESLQDEEDFPESLTNEIQRLFESGKITDQGEVLNALQGDLDEDPESGNQ